MNAIYYVKIIHGGDFDCIPISMFGHPAIFKTLESALKFKNFSEGAGHKVEVCEWPAPTSTEGGEDLA